MKKVFMLLALAGMFSTTMISCGEKKAEEKTEAEGAEKPAEETPAEETEAPVEEAPVEADTTAETPAE